MQAGRCTRRFHPAAALIILLFHVFSHYCIAGMVLSERLGAALECSNKAFVFEEKKNS